MELQWMKIWRWWTELYWFRPRMRLSGHVRFASDRRQPQSYSAWSATAYSLAAARDYLPPELAAQKKDVLARGKQWLLN